MQYITSAADLDSVFEETGLVWLLKHSNACSISTAALQEVSTYGKQSSEPIYILIIQDHRDLSAEIATRIGRVHQSPQLFLLREGKPIWSATHWGITSQAMFKALAGA